MSTLGRWVLTDELGKVSWNLMVAAKAPITYLHSYGEQQICRGVSKCILSIAACYTARAYDRVHSERPTRTFRQDPGRSPKSLKYDARVAAVGTELHHLDMLPHPQNGFRENYRPNFETCNRVYMDRKQDVVPGKDMSNF